MVIGFWTFRNPEVYDVGFEHDTNEVLIIGRDGDQHHVPLAHKRDVARAVLDRVTTVLHSVGRADEEQA